MGAGIVQVAAQAGLKVTMVDLSPKVLEKGTSIINTSLNRVAKKKHPDSSDDQNSFVTKVLSNITTTTDSAAAVQDTDLLIEAIVENVAKKQELFSTLDKIAPQKTIFASNTSSLPISDIASLTNRKDRFAGLHFFNPVPQMKLVEIIRTTDTSQETFDKLKSLSKTLGKTWPWFVNSRIL